MLVFVDLWLIQKEEMKQKCFVETLIWAVTAAAVWAAGWSYHTGRICVGQPIPWSHCLSYDNIRPKVIINSIIWRRKQLLSFIGYCTAAPPPCGCIVAFSGWKRNDSSAQQSSQVLPNPQIPPVMVLLIKKKEFIQVSSPTLMRPASLHWLHHRLLPRKPVAAQKHWHRG